MRKIVPTVLLAIYTLLIITVEGLYLLAAWAAMKLGWVPKKK